jgi:hypothetical protein
MFLLPGDYSIILKGLKIVIDSLQHVGMQLNLEGKTKEVQSPENWGVY